MKFLPLILLLIISCGRKTVYTVPAMPANQASLEVKSDINDELEKLEKEFKDIDVTIDLKRLPVVVAPLPFGVVGRCQYGNDDRGVYIILSPALFNRVDFLPLDDSLFEKEFVRVLIHEIGHCYFRRMHEPPEYLEMPGSSFELRHEETAVLFDKIPTSLMPAESVYRMPKALRKYYLSELVGKSKLSNPTVLGEFTEFAMVNTQVPEVKSDTVEPTDEDGGEIAQFFKCSGPEDSPEEFRNF
ncbi:MAG: hypothetical protein V4598_15810 [Bdellovibrionota bacterium]